MEGKSASPVEVGMAGEREGREGIYRYFAPRKIVSSSLARTGCGQAGREKGGRRGADAMELGGHEQSNEAEVPSKSGDCLE